MNAGLAVGTIEQLWHPEGEWVFVDLGFSSKSKTCGYLHERRVGGTTPPESLHYGRASDRLAELALKPDPPLHLVLEAPLSIGFDSQGNPAGREGERNGSQHRYWYENAGCCVLVAALFLLRRIQQQKPMREVRLFEGLVSFRKKTRSDHCKDVCALRDVVWSCGKKAGEFVPARPLEPDPPSSLESIMALLGGEPTPPPIIKVHSA